MTEPTNDNFSNEAYWRHNIMFLDFTITNFLDIQQRQVFIDQNLRISEQGSPFILQEMATGKQSYQDPYQNNYRSTWSGNVSYQLTGDMLLFAGAEYESRSVGEYQRTDIKGNFDALQVQATKITEKSAFAQLDWTFGNYRLVLGGRFVDNELTGSAISPRLSAIYNLGQQNSVKVLYSEGYNSPTLSQVNLNINNFIFGNINLKAETLETLDIAYTRANPRQIITVNAYHIHTNNFIARFFKNLVPGLKDGPDIQSSNTDSFSRTGLEIDYQQVWDPLTLLANMAYNREGNTTDKNDLLANGVPRYTLNLGLNWQLNEQGSVGLSLRYWSERGGDNCRSLLKK
nr:TonB-dependent receptor [Thalassomonas sp. RHCl1]